MTTKVMTTKRFLGALFGTISLMPILIRTPDYYLADTRVAQYLGFQARLVLLLLVSVCVLSISLRMPYRTFILLQIAFWGVKSYADESVPFPNLTCENRPDHKCVILVTGATSGIGLGTAQEIVSHGHTLLMGCRTEAKCDEAIKNMSIPEDQQHLVKKVPGLELSDLKMIRNVTNKENMKGILGDNKTIDIVVASAGLVPVGNKLTKQEIEMGLGVMYFGHYGLIEWLYLGDILSLVHRVVIVSSDLAYLGTFHESLVDKDNYEDDLKGQITRGCEKAEPACLNFSSANIIVNSAGTESYCFGSYPRAKLANIMHARWLYERRTYDIDKKKDPNARVGVASVHPGLVDTSLAQFVSPFQWLPEILIRLRNQYIRYVLRSPKQAAAIVMSGAEWDKAQGGFLNGRAQVVSWDTLPPEASHNDSLKNLWIIGDKILSKVIDNMTAND
eukprot:m.14641 g.14641  ORF g.14641 m.14641 type:complete len:446 (+) comp5173_c0_seq1:161-1498(+)